MPSALAIFTCRPNSHPFQERHVYLDEPVKIGRSVARCRPAQNNATFDCKVLSRNHALVWFDHKTGKFYLQDTKSSNGTFINSQRLSRGSEESPPCEILSGDIIQFGVDVTENTRKVTHGCIVSTVKLFLPDGLETRRRSDVIPAALPSPIDKVAAHTPSMYSQELFQLSQYLQEALHREQMLEQKLATLQRLLANTQEASDTSWQALIDEDRLLSRLEVMGNQLQAYSKSQTDDGIRKEMIALQEDKHNYETTAKESLRRVLQEKIEVVRKLSEVERSLSNTEDECTHLKEMNERTQEELRELANKYNGAVNEIKDLADKLKAAESRQEEIQQKALAEKKELQNKIDEMEEKEQELQAKIEALQADNDFTNERLTALQVRLEHLQEKTLKEHNSLGIQVGDFIPKINGNADKDKLIDQHLIRGDQERQRLKESPPEAKESDLSDTLSPSKEKSSDDTTDGQMDEQELNESPNKVTLLKDELLHAGANEAKPEIQQLHKELLEAQEALRTSKQKCLELQALLEEESRAGRQQAEESTKQIQHLQAQLQRLQKEIEVLREQKENEIGSTREALLHAQEEIEILKRVSEQVASEREGDIAELQGELQEVRFELEHWRKAASQYEKEIENLQASFQAQSRERDEQQRKEAARWQAELEGLRQNVSSLDGDCLALRKENALLSEQCQRIERELHSSQKQSQDLTNDLSVLELSRKELENQVGCLKDQNQREAANLKIQLKEAEKRVVGVQQDFDNTQMKLSELRETVEKAEQEKQSVVEELKQCKENLKLLQEKGTNRQWPWITVVAAALFAVTAVMLYPGLTKGAP
ncbi:sarcolemmal membrane-associated protein [Xenopus tropicalis]|uniref:Sarcolemmal membrane-associated protein n=1 Tax=Xenopus tropicalis TaxID=8364 RepID=A9JRJ0_XENTR|nr:sarcolemmal membrane-associated protein [Xenopus tropicalis]AAI55681.1 LOC100135075 protein [Xenopus tropicalis]|eukprot:NP_001107286.1 sarcolemmal membrane-associated protein [Xenopus tropicalis]